MGTKAVGISLGKQISSVTDLGANKALRTLCVWTMNLKALWALG